MARRKKNQDYISFIGESSRTVTGSMYLVQFGKYKILLECGLYQSSKNDYLDAYRVNTEKFEFDPSEIDFVFNCHAHVDHCGLLPRLVKEGFRGQIIMNDETKKFVFHLLMNSAYILKDEARILSNRFGRDYKPIYEPSDVYHAMDLVHTYSEYDRLFQLDEGIRFQWLTNSHCPGACQLQLILTGENKEKKILYTSDIGSLQSPNHFVGKTEVPDFFNDIVIMESTYGDPARSKRKTRKFDLQHLDSAIRTTLDRNGSVLLPAFSFARTQELLVSLYELYGKDPEFTTEIVVDSMLSVDLCRTYEQVLIDDEYLLWQEIMNWKNLRLIKPKDQSLENLSRKTSQIIISASGFCTSGRVLDYLCKLIKDENSMIIFSGYIGDNPSYLAYRIKNAEGQKTITLNHHRLKNKANCITMSSFSSHANTSDLVTYAGAQNTNRIVLVHGEPEAKQELKQLISKEFSRQDKTAQVIASRKNMIIEL